jgi:hypothetical protein
LSTAACERTNDATAGTTPSSMAALVVDCVLDAVLLP